MTVGILGLGKMGRAMAEKLVEDGVDLIVWNRSPGKAEGLDAKVAASPAALAAECDVILSILTDDAAIAQVYDGPDGLLSADLAGKTIVEMTTTAPETSRALEPKVAAAGGQLLECPVGGTVGPAREGQLLGLAGGSEAAFAAAKPVLEKITRRLEHLGPMGSGAAMKLAINLPLMIYWGALGEALRLAGKGGIDTEQALSILADSSGAIGAAKRRVGPIGAFLADGTDGATAFQMETAIKDMGLMQALGGGSDVPLISAALEQAKRAEADGFGTRDASLLAAWVASHE
ncbi:NAD(P)-dependent oxidoreductase [Ponticoccus sp. SC2-23]|uniref:NAD(P)-dependent oxidoreductase n=1 Tax=Alexandriicola marinus TaxID=2081710 RepID=UPI000FD78517|nr:NAD(P)-dependent oxidoreductase [Alexandriicola marinus]MBM1219168.1 NAD(P)-dependent oxidoreductase [Ponticoccus sp. SC6-9]MBM1223760.1 NAD(P)-dependent oxidoreductase [Ponticoccus sp. SC6-15]MBM1228982.1 NAD(P)-dependent oxidoreductase [Ponticoccus sp. SC6-38]MBM1232726.1 NAD(P)-dependent oxidoreductase [Ponticoccus sp. SC6-45]MBM1237324.1 NAD(P)-dependent oxidoreductase [Ponticoccus sp. SC6-49]MBM1241737.1 NAD(P)-dependent oxidoreductase [Ponticoccus sp. SC2-64]MBM1246250.1 NAD(P)-depe